MASTPTNNFDFQNFYSGQLTADITGSSLTISLDTVPTPSEGILVIEPDSTSNREIIYYTSKGASTITCPSDGRGWDGTTGVSHLTGSTVIMAPVAYMLRMLKSGSLFDTTRTGWTTVGQTLTYSANNGQKEFVLNTPVDLTSTLSVGNKLKFDRITTPPTQAMSFSSASSQYATKASPSGLSFTGAFTIEGWFYLNSYVNSMPISRVDVNANGFYMQISGSGQVVCGFGSSNVQTSGTSYQSLPLKRWVHVAAVCTSVSSKTFAIYINGVSVPLSVSGTTTALTQTGNLTIGAWSAASSQYFDGYISEARVWSTAQSQASIQANMAISLTGSETNLVALFQGNGNFNDKTSNANNLTATNGAIATQAANPYNSTEYGIITKVSSTQLTIFTGTDYNIPNATLSTPYYSTSRAPFGFPSGRDKWRVDYLLKADQTQASPVQNTWYNLGTNLLVPTGEWTTYYEAGIITQHASVPNQFLTLSTANNSESDTAATAYGQVNGIGALIAELKKTVYLNLASATTYYLNTKSNQASTTSIVVTGTSGTSQIVAECAYV